MKMFSILFMLGCVASPLQAIGGWSPTPPDAITTIAQGNTLVTCAPCPVNSEGYTFLGLWRDQNFFPNITFYNGANTPPWTHPQTIPITNPRTVGGYVYSSLGANINKSLIAWTDNASSNIYYSIVDGALTVSDPMPIPFPIGSGFFAPSCYDPTSSRFLVAGFYVNGLKCAVLDSTLAWSDHTPTPLTPGFFGELFFASCNTHNGDCLITWLNISDSKPYYAVFNLRSRTFTVQPAEIPGKNGTPGLDINPYFFIFSAFDPNLNQFIISWVDQANTTHYPHYTTYTYSGNTATWGTPGAMSPANPVPALFDSPVWPAIDPVSGTFFFTWINPGSLPYYSTYLKGAWSVPLQIPQSSIVNNSTVSAFSTIANKFMVTWDDGGNNSNPNLNGLLLYDTFTLKLQTTTTVTSRPNPSRFTQKILLKATVTASDASIPNGVVVFTSGKMVLGRVMLDNSGIARLSTCVLPRGSDLITATFKGNENFSPSSGTTVQVVK